jgi:iron-sulfur cluster assembly accessory protein
MQLDMPVKVADSVFARLAEISEAEGAAKSLRVAVLGGGCSGFQYEFTLEEGGEADDQVIEKDGMKVLIDPASAPFLANSVVEFKDELIGARFTIDNPNATSTCGCGTSFSM